MSIWEKAQEWEKSWWGNCVNTTGEEKKQLLYARKMGLQFFHNGKSPYNIDMQGKSVLDVGGGPCSLLLKCVNVVGSVYDPLKVPQWVRDRYTAAGIGFYNQKAEMMVNFNNDEIWIYNVLQHVENPESVARNAQKAAKLIRLFEWIDTPTNIGHPHSLSEGKLNEWLGGYGKVEQIDGEANCWGRAYYGIFPT